MANVKLKQGSIRHRLIYIFLIASIVPIIILGTISYFVSVKVIEEKVSSSSVKTLTHISEVMEGQIGSLNQLMDQVFVDKSIKKVISTRYENDTEYNYDMKEVYELIDSFYTYSSVSKYVSSIIILGNNGKLIKLGEDGYTVPLNIIKSNSLLKQAEDSNGKIIWSKTHKNWADVYIEEYVISAARLLKDERLERGIGTAFFSFKESVFKDLYKNIQLGQNGSIFIIDKDGLVISHNNKDLLNVDLSGNTYIKDMLDKQSGYTITKINNVKMLVTYCTSSKTGWKIVEAIPLKDLIKESNIIGKVTVIVAFLCLAMSFVFAWFITKKISRPIMKLKNTMKQIEKGNLAVRADESSRDEIGELSHSFNFMVDKINKLFEEVVSEQVGKKEAEYKVLLSQINPHFLYNTLNSIKWMAIIQNADSIRQMVSALGRLLQNSIKDIGSLITITEELELTKDYIYIQSFRYKDKFTVNYNIEKQVMDYKTPKFILQPVIENAIFHGLEPKEGIGKIDISIYQEDNKVVFYIKDDGIGMEEETIKKIFTLSSKNERGFSAIGIKNVDERIKRFFGKEYGMNIKSQRGLFTEVTITIPITDG